MYIIGDVCNDSGAWLVVNGHAGHPACAEPSPSWVWWLAWSMLEASPRCWTAGGLVTAETASGLERAIFGEVDVRHIDDWLNRHITARLGKGVSGCCSGRAVIGMTFHPARSW